jgi:3-hydroxybutyryl-CoA dehydratase
LTGAGRDPIVRHGTAATRFSELALGDEIWDAVTVTESHLVLAAAVFNDPGPNHINALQAAQNRFGTRIAHGPLLIGIMDGALGNVLGSTIVALLEQNARFLHPTLPGDTVLSHWRVAELIPKPEKFDGGGVVKFAGEALNQDGRVLVEMTVALAVADRPLWSAAQHAAEAAAARPTEPSTEKGV